MPATSSSLVTTSRIQSIDFVRGLVMVLMAIDHVRVYSGLPAGGPEPGIFFTRWVTHFCAPAFVFLSGTSAYLYGVKIGDIKKLSIYLFSRGILLVILELTIIRFFWTFNFNYSQFTLAGVIWMFGWCMVLMALLVKLKPKVVGFIGLAIIFLQNTFGLVPSLLPESMRVPFGRFWEFIYSSGLEGPSSVTILYVLVPWIGVMAAGYGFGMIFEMEPARRKKLLIQIGSGSILLFLIGGSTLVMMNDNLENSQPFVFKLLNQQKYPASQLFLLMTLGPSILLMPFVENARGGISSAIVTFGRVPFFYYLIHIPLIHVSALLAQLITRGQTFPELFNTAPYTWMEEADRWSLSLLYLVFLIDVMILYFACRWYEKLRFNTREDGLKNLFLK